MKSSEQRRMEGLPPLERQPPIGSNPAWPNWECRSCKRAYDDSYEFNKCAYCGGGLWRYTKLEVKQ